MKKGKAHLYLFFLPSFLTLIFLFSCSLNIFEDFTISYISIPENGVIGTEKQGIEILFSREVSEQSISDNIWIESDSSTEVPFGREVSGNQVLIIPDEEWKPHERYWLIITRDVMDIFGKKMGKDFYLPFQSTEELLPVSAVLLSPVVINGIVGDDTDFIQILFSSEVDKNSVEREFNVSPEADGYFEWVSNQTLIFHFKENLKKNSYYSIQVSDNAKDVYGYKIKSFLKDFEYCPNQPYGEIEAIILDVGTIFERSNPSTYAVENGVYIINYDKAEKDSILRIDFSSPIDQKTFLPNFQITPFIEWHETWISENIVEISFEDLLMLNEHYQINISREIKNMDGLTMQYTYLLNLFVDGDTSRYIEFYAGDFTELQVSVEDVALWTGGSKIDSAVQGVELLESNEGYTLEIDYDENMVQQDVSEIEVQWAIFMKFNTPFYTPVIDKRSLQDAINFRLVFGNEVYPGSIYSFNWENTNECSLEIREMGAGNIYKFSIAGGKSGVTDDQNNYMASDVEYYFSVVLVP